jgi:hypothetical protein
MQFIDELSTARLTQLRALWPHVDTASPALAESWRRSARSDVDLATVATSFVGATSSKPVLEICAIRLLDETSAETGAYSILVLDETGVIRLGNLLDALTLSPGYDLSERLVGTTAATLALATGSEVELAGHAHYHPQLAGLTESAAPVCDARTGETRGVLAIVTTGGTDAGVSLAHARRLAHDLSLLIDHEPSRRARTVFEQFVDRSSHSSGWVVSTDGSSVFSGDAAAALDPTDLRVLTDSAVGSFALREFGTSEVELPSGIMADIRLEAVLLDGEAVGTTLVATPCEVDDARQLEAVRRQGAHVASSTKRDYALAYGSAPGGHLARDTHPLRTGDGLRDNRELMTPFLRAKHDVVNGIRSHRNHLIIGEAGVGKHSLVIGEFVAQHPHGRVLTADCANFEGDVLPFRSASGSLFHGTLEEGPHLLLIGGLETLSPVGARHLDEILRPLDTGASGPLLVASVNETTIDLSRPYGLVMHYFAETIRVPPLRLRIDDIGDLAVTIMRKLAGGRSLRLSYQAIRILEGYRWPGNVSELEDVLRYVIARKPVGEVQARDLPAVCFQGSSRRLSMLESAQRDAIIQALYEAKGNRYRAAAALGIARSSLYRKIDAFGISYIA